MLSVNSERLVADLEELGRIGRVERGGLSRSSFSPADVAARKWYFGRCADAGLSAKVDGIGNIIVSSPAVSTEISSRPAVWSGSHIDTVPSGGKFDGALGAIAALECLRRVHEEDIDLERPLCSVVYTDEEGNFASLLGSSALARGYSRSELEAMIGRDGDRFVDTFAAAGGDLGAATRTRIDPALLHATVELHIEQGPVLEELGHQIGVVTGIVGLGRGVISFRGRSDHAGTMPMIRRQDALVAASKFLILCPDLAASVSDSAVVTCGIITVEPGSANVVPGIAHVTVDFRDAQADRVATLESTIIMNARSIATEYGLDVDIDLEKIIPPAPLDQGIQKIIANKATARGLSSSLLASGAGHDSQNMTSLASTGMIFVPSIGGRSHCPEENTSWADVENGANVLLDTLVQLASS